MNHWLIVITSSNAAKEIAFEMRGKLILNRCVWIAGSTDAIGARQSAKCAGVSRALIIKSDSFVVGALGGIALGLVLNGLLANRIILWEMVKVLLEPF